MRYFCVDYCPGKTKIYKQSHLFKHDKEFVDDDKRLRRPSDVPTHEIVMKFQRAAIENDGRKRSHK